MAKNKNKKNLDLKPAKVDENSEVKTEDAGADDNDKLRFQISQKRYYRFSIISKEL